MQRYNEEKSIPCVNLATSQIEQCVSAYENSRSFFSSWFSKELDGVVKFKEFYHQTIKHSFGLLTINEFFDFITLIKIPIASPLIISLRELIASPWYFELIKVFDAQGLSTPKSYAALYELSQVSQKRLLDLPANPSIAWLVKNNLLNDANIDFIRDDLDITNSLSFIQSHAAARLMPILKQHQLLDNDLLKIQTLHEISDLFLEVIYFLNDKQLLNKALFYAILQQHQQDNYSGYFLHKMIRLLFENNVLNHATLLIAMQGIKYISFIECATLLAREKLLAQFADKLPKNSYEFRKVLEYLDAVNALNASTVEVTIAFLNASPENNFDLRDLLELFRDNKLKLSNSTYQLLLSKKISFKDIKEVFELLSKANLANNNCLFDLLSLTKDQFNECNRILYALNENKLLDITAFKKACAMLTVTLKEPEESEIKKISRKTSGKARSELIINDNTHVFIEHKDAKSKKYAEGGCGLIKQGFETLDGIQPKFSIKKLKGSLTTKEAAIETKYQRLFGNKSYYFQRKKQWDCTTFYSVSLWRAGKDLSLVTKDEILNYPITTRLKWLISGLADVNVLHQIYRVHGDIKPGNFILDPTQETLRLIDFGTTRERQQHSYLRTNLFLPASMHYGYHFFDDVYSMGIVAASIFPDLYAIDLKQPRAIITQIKKRLTLKEQSIINLIKAMLHQDDSLRCSIYDALEYTKQLSAGWKTLDKPTLDRIAQKTIDHNNLTVNDIIYESYRSVRVS